MGAGLALEFKLRYPEMYLQYKDDCDNGKVRIGELKTYRCDDSPLIVNFPTKDHWREPSELWYVEKGLDYLMEHYREWGVRSIAIPPLGCSNGHLDYSDVKKIIDTKLKDIDIDAVVCIDPGYPEGKEKEMVDNYVSSNLDFICDYLEITPKGKGILISNQRIKRFFNILNLEGIGETTYEKLFDFFYRNDPKKMKDLESRMVRSYSEYDLTRLCDDLGFKGVLKKNIISSKGIERFNDLMKIEKMTNPTYRKIFEYMLDYDFNPPKPKRKLNDFFDC